MQRSTQGNKNQQATQYIYSRPLLFVWALQFGAFREELDDTIMQWANQAKNNKRLEAVMIRLQEANVMLNGEKCKFLKVTIKFLGQLVGTYADPGTVPAVNHMAELTDVPDLWWFLEMEENTIQTWLSSPTRSRNFSARRTLGFGVCPKGTHAV